LAEKNNFKCLNILPRLLKLILMNYMKALEAICSGVRRLSEWYCTLFFIIFSCFIWSIKSNSKAVTQDLVSRNLMICFEKTVAMLFVMAAIMGGTGVGDNGSSMR